MEHTDGGGYKKIKTKGHFQTGVGRVCAVDTYLYGMNEALVERQGDYIEGKVPHAGLRVEKAL